MPESDARSFGLGTVSLFNTSWDRGPRQYLFGDKYHTASMLDRDHSLREFLTKIDALTCPPSEDLLLTIRTETLSYLNYVKIRVQELCESGGGRPGLPVLMSLTISVDVKHIEPCLGIGQRLSLICQLTSEDMKLYFIACENISLTFHSRRLFIKRRALGNTKGGLTRTRKRERDDEERRKWQFWK